MSRTKVNVKQETLLRESAAIENAAAWLQAAKSKSKTLNSATPCASCSCQT